MKKIQFKAESKKLLDLMINSIYTNKEIFLRELLSNANDAIDKLHFKSLTDTKIKSDFSIKIEVDKENRKLKIIDEGIGMTRNELENNLGTIAKSGSQDFKKQNEENENNIIGQFGVGFYSAFMVAKEVEVLTKSYEEEKAYLWKSKGTDGFTIEEAKKESIGTTITLTMKDDTENENYSEFLEQYKIISLIKKYSDYLSYPIKMECEHQKPKENKKEGEEQEFETYKTIDTINSITPIWNKNKNELKEEEINDFYKEKFRDFQNPAKTIFYKTEGAATFSSILFIPSATPFNYYTKEFKKDLQLYSHGVLIMENCTDLLPDYFGFVKGMVDSKDLSLNISREILQKTQQLHIISKSLTKKVKNELLNWLKNDRTSYEEFFKNFGISLKYGIYQQYGMHKEELKDLLIFKSSFEDKYVTLKEYVNRMKEDQKDIYYATGESYEKIKNMPQTEFFKDKKFEILYFINEVDEFAIKMLNEYEGKKFQNITSKEVDIESEEEKNKIKEEEKKHENMFTIMKEALKDKVLDVKISNKLKSSAVCLSTAGEISIEMEKVLNAIPNSQKVQSQKILEINKNHKLFKKLCFLEQNDKEKLKEYSKILFVCAALMEGISPENPVDFLIKNKIINVNNRCFSYFLFILNYSLYLFQIELLSFRISFCFKIILLSNNYLSRLFNILFVSYLLFFLIFFLNLFT